MNKDVIYIDVEDDVTAIIGKIKASKEKIVALVPPKRVGVLQSAVNLRLLDRMATTAKKRLVLITNNQALVSLSASAGIPVAKNLQSKPELAEISALEVDEGEDVIDGSSLPVGELEKTSDTAPVGKLADKPSKDDAVNDTVQTLDIDDMTVPVGAAAVNAVAAANVKPHKSSKPKVPNFDKFRRRLFIIIAAVIVLVGFLIWANVFAPAATIIITARTTAEPVSTAVTVADNLTTSIPKSTIQSTTKQIQKSQSVQFTPTGQKDIGTPAAYIVELSQRGAGATVPAGTDLTASDGLIFVTQSTANVPASPSGNSCAPFLCPGTTTVSVNAQSTGTNYNNETGSLSGAPSGVSASFQSQTTNGTPSDVVTVVSASDITAATAQLTQLSGDTYKTQLEKEFTSSQIAIGDSFASTAGTPTSDPAVNQQANGKATLTATTTYTLSGVSKSDVEAFLKAAINTQLAGTSNQRVYDDGISKVSLTGFTAGTPNTMTIVSTGQIGPNIDETVIKKQSEGKIYGDVQSNLDAIVGVDNVDVKFSYPWVTSVPNDPNRIKIEFKLEND